MKRLIIYTLDVYNGFDLDCQCLIRGTICLSTYLCKIPHNFTADLKSFRSLSLDYSTDYSRQKKIEEKKKKEITRSYLRFPRKNETG